LKVEVNEQPKRFYLAFSDKWVSVVGHEITVGEYKFSAVATPKNIIFSEATSGVKIISMPMSFPIYMLTTTKEDTISFYQYIGKKLKRIIEKDSNFNSKIEVWKNKALDLLGEMPPIEDVDERMILAGKSDEIH